MLPANLYKENIIKNHFDCEDYTDISLLIHKEAFFIPLKNAFISVSKLYKSGLQWNHSNQIQQRIDIHR